MTSAAPLDVADEADAALLTGLLQQRKGLVLQRAALRLLGADVQQPDAGRGAAHHFTGVKAAHERKLQQLLH